MSTLTNRSTHQNLADATLSLKAVRQYQQGRREYGAQRVDQYFDDVEGNWLEQFDDSEANNNDSEDRNLSQAICEDN
jgi:hypothetical protein